ncbi:hypothetical protein [uncultured Rikenella sp.]|uniref:hypothetical protein n=1 Tax=uncultured Rikenella sp. TaxID=368003 RepID=UPI0025D41688|nr:hypothetical protein [uncultured Rikenella sp.]
MTRFPKAREKTNPAPGRSNYGEGKPINAGNEGSVWSTLANETLSVNLRFSPSGISPCYSAYRAGGFQLRCLSE